ncbi:hypothetical protein Tco_0531994 [Tanacetum coccineum]
MPNTLQVSLLFVPAKCRLAILQKIMANVIGTLNMLGLAKRFKQTNTEYQKEFAPEFPSSNNLLRYAKLCYSFAPYSKVQRDNQLQNSFACIDAASADGEQLFELFNGFQKIGALEQDPLISDLTTPNFAMHVSATTNGGNIIEEAAKNGKEEIVDPL